MADLNQAGFLNLNKPAGWTSHDCVAKVRRLFQLKKVGHGGTLDPAATGVLPIALGRATRLIPYLAGTKAYRAVIRFGIVTTTDDLEGEVMQQQDSTHLALTNVQAILPQFTGTITQIPPKYSAIQVDGQRLYDRARRGEAVDVPARTVEIFHIAPVSWQPGNAANPYPELTVDIVCGTGTYIRAIARDVGAKLGTGATLAALTRTNSSGFTLANSHVLDDLEQLSEADRWACLASPEVGLAHLPRLVLPSDLARRWQQGQKLEPSPELITAIAAHNPPDMVAAFADQAARSEATDPSPSSVTASVYQIYAPPDDFLGIGAIASQPLPGRLVPKMVFQPY